MQKTEPLVNRKCLLEKFPGKGGWTYAEIPEIRQSKDTPFGMAKVKGSIDGHELRQYNLMPMGNGNLFLPINAAIRKKIGKEAGDFVKVILYSDESPLEIPEEIMQCFKHEPEEAWATFKQLSEREQKAYLTWIYEAKREETKVERIVKMMDRLLKGMKLYEKDENR